MRIISGKYGRRRFDVPTNISARPTTDMARENLFNVLAHRMELEGKTAVDLFAGTGAISFELLSRGCSAVTAVEKARVQCEFIRSVAQRLGEEHLTLVRGDVFRFVESCRQRFDIVFADPPYDLPRFGEVPQLVLASALVGPGTLFVMEHPRAYDFSTLPHFEHQRAYGKVHFSFFAVPATTQNPE